MRRSLPVVLFFLVATLLLAIPAWAETHAFNLAMASSIGGTNLEPGSYKVEVSSSGEAIIYSGKKVVAKARAEVKPVDTATAKRGVVRASNGRILEIRCKKVVVLFTN